MKYKTLGKSGIKVSEIGFGAWTIGLDWWGKKIEEDEGWIQPTDSRRIPADRPRVHASAEHVDEAGGGKRQQDLKPADRLKIPRAGHAPDRGHQTGKERRPDRRHPEPESETTRCAMGSTRSRLPRQC